MRIPMMLALSLLVAASEAHAAPPKEGQAEPPKAEHIGDLICTVGEASVKPGMLCVFRNKNTGLEETYQGSLANSGGASVNPKHTLLWSVDAKPAIELKPGVLAQRYEAEGSESEKLKSIKGDDKPGLSLSLVTEKNKDLAALAALTVELKLISAPA